ncbi:MAG: zf-HC2 domain-containing protein [Anaerolineae bacterium]|nr:zf-HC2 domain-containing protein [Anaerolineae bacterium]MDW8100661.1 zf-HC2 domain-containing protein [Anaerolineae bacterium]
MASRSERHEHKRIRVTDELLSAYLDDEVTPEERAAVEQAIARDPEIALRLRALRQTIALLSELPRAPLPRAFTLSEADVSPLYKRPFWLRWRFSLLAFSLRGATAIAAALLVVLLVSDLWWARQTAIPADRGTTQTMLETPNTPLPLEESPAAATAIAQAPTATPTEEVIAAQAANEAAPAAQVTVQEAAPTVMAAERPTQELPTPEHAVSEMTIVTAEAVSSVIEALAAPVEGTPTPETAVQEEAAIEQTEPPMAPGMLEPPDAIPFRGAVAPVPPGAGGGAEGGGAPGAIRIPFAQPLAPRQVPPEESGMAVMPEAALMLTSTPTSTPTATPSPTATPTPAPTATSTVTPSPTFEVMTALPTPTPASVAIAQAEASAPEGLIGELPASQPGPFGLSRAQTRTLEVALGALVVILGIASWLIRPR